MATKLMIALLLAGGLTTGCSSSPETPAERSNMSSQSTAGLDHFLLQDPGLRAELDRAAGYAIFPELGKAGVILGATYGNGEVYEKGVKIGYAELSQGTIGAQLGAQAFSELIVFRTQEALNDFKDGEFSFAANATAVAIKPGAAASATYNDGVAIFVHIKGGLMAEAAVGGQRFTFKPL
jgi:lipid-binding SYLF domain-containing protein